MAVISPEMEQALQKFFQREDFTFPQEHRFRSSEVGGSANDLRNFLNDLRIEAFGRAEAPDRLPMKEGGNSVTVNFSEEAFAAIREKFLRRS